MKNRSFLSIILLLLIALSAKSQNNSGWEWASVSGTATGSPGNKVLDIATDASGNVYTVGTYNVAITIGTFSLPTPTGRDIFIAKYNSSGTIIWLKNHTPPTGYNEVGEAINVDSDGNVYIGGVDDTPPNYAGLAFLAKYDSAGNMLWNKFFSLYEVGGINIGADGNPIIMESAASAKNIRKINKTDGSTIWTASCTGAGSNAGTTYQDFTDASRNIYFTCFTLSAGAVNILGDSYTTTGTTSFIASVNSNGTKRWVQKIDNIQVQLGYTVDANGKSYIQMGGGFGGTFQGISTASPLGDRYFELDNTGTVTRHLTASPYKGLFRVKSNGIYGYEIAQSAGVSYTEMFGDYYFRVPATPNTRALGIVIKYNPTDNDKVVWANSLEITGYANNSGSINTIETGTNNKILIGGAYGTTLKTGATTYTATGAGFAPTDLYVAQFNGTNVAVPPVTNWTGNAGNNLWTDAGNWDNGAPNGSEKVVFPAGIVTYPTGITATNVAGRLEIASGINLSLPMGFVAPGGIENNGTIIITSTGAFTGFNAGNTLVSGTGKLVFNAAGPSSLNLAQIGNGIEVNRPSGISLSKNLEVTGDVVLTAGLVSGAYSFTMSNPNSVLTANPTAYFTNTFLVRAVNGSGLYNFPIGTSDRYVPAVLQLNNTVGPQTIKASFSTAINGAAPNTSVGGKTVTTVLNSGIWTITPTTYLTGGNYSITLEGRGYTNGVADTEASRYVVLKRDAYNYAWGFYGQNGTSSQTSGAATATAGNITGFSDFAIGIANGDVPTTLPVKLVNFVAKADGKASLLTWQTQTEINNDRFEVERSLDGLSWIKIGAVKGAGNNYQPKDYVFRDVLPANGNNYYRLKQVDNNQLFEYSGVKTVKFSLTNDDGLSFYPNPAVNELYFTGFSPDYKLVALSDLNGKLVFSTTIVGESLKLPGNLLNGVYALKVKSGEKLLIRKLIINR